MVSRRGRVTTTTTTTKRKSLSLKIAPPAFARFRKEHQRSERSGSPESRPRTPPRGRATSRRCCFLRWWFSQQRAILGRLRRRPFRRRRGRCRCFRYLHSLLLAPSFWLLLLSLLKGMAVVLGWIGLLIIRTPSLFSSCFLLRHSLVSLTSKNRILNGSFFRFATSFSFFAKSIIN